MAESGAKIESDNGLGVISEQPQATAEPQLFHDRLVQLAPGKLPPVNDVNTCKCACDDILSPDFKNGLLSCCSCRVCCSCLCMLPCLAAQTRQLVERRDCSLIDFICCLPLFETRRKLRSHRGYPQRTTQDICATALCCPCACYQTAAEAGVETECQDSQCYCDGCMWTGPGCDCSECCCCCECPCGANTPSGLAADTTPSCICPGQCKLATCCNNNAGECTVEQGSHVMSCRCPAVADCLPSCQCNADICHHSEHGCHLQCQDACPDMCSCCGDCQCCKTIDCTSCSLKGHDLSCGQKCDNCLRLEDCNILGEICESFCTVYGEICQAACNTVCDSACSEFCEKSCNDCCSGCCEGCSGCDCNCNC